MHISRVHAVQAAMDLLANAAHATSCSGMHACRILSVGGSHARLGGCRGCRWGQAFWPERVCGPRTVWPLGGRHHGELRWLMGCCCRMAGTPRMELSAGTCTRSASARIAAGLICLQSTPAHPQHCNTVERMRLVAHLLRPAPLGIRQALATRSASASASYVVATARGHVWGLWARHCSAML